MLTLVTEFAVLSIAENKYKTEHVCASLKYHGRYGYVFLIRCEPHGGARGKVK